MTRSAAWTSFVLVLCSSALAHEAAVVCFNYACSAQAEVRFDERGLKTVAAEFTAVTSAQEERVAVSRAVGRLYALAGASTPIGQDRGENVFDDGVDGRMDCIDHSANTTTFLGIAERRGWLRFHRLGAPDRRGWFLTVHWTATLVERGGGERFAVDSWFRAPGEAAVVYPLALWRDGARPPRQYPRTVGE